MMLTGRNIYYACWTQLEVQIFSILIQIKYKKNILNKILFFLIPDGLKNGMDLGSHLDF